MVGFLVAVTAAPGLLRATAEPVPGSAGLWYPLPPNARRSAMSALRVRRGIAALSFVLSATAKVLRRALAVTDPEAAALSIDGKPCTGGRCGFQAKKGETYRLRATTAVRDANELCIAVTRP